MMNALKLDRYENLPPGVILLRGLNSAQVAANLSRNIDVERN